MFSLLLHHIKFQSHLVEKCARQYNQEVLFCADLVTPNQGEGHLKWYEIVKVDGACKQGRIEKKLE